MVDVPKQVNICECWARDGIQGWDPFVPTEKKIAIINRMVEIGFKRIEATSFAHPKLIKQFADSMEVLKGIQRPKDLTYIAIIPNDKALDRLFEACNMGVGVQEITAILSASEDHLLANLERTFAEAMPPLASIVKRARQAGIKVIGCIGTAFGCPLAYPIANELDGCQGQGIACGRHSLQSIRAFDAPYELAGIGIASNDIGVA